MNFRFQLGRRPDISGLPFGFWFGWGPKDEAPPASFYKPTNFSWSFGAYWYLPRQIPARGSWLWRIPRLHFNGHGPLGPRFSEELEAA